jgi:hypothetical protein
MSKAAAERRSKPDREAGIPADRYVAERRGAYYFVIDRATGGITAGPYGDRDRAQREADRWNVNTWQRGRRG